MGKFDERALRARKERIDLFGDKSATVIISRPQRRVLGPDEVAKFAKHVAAARPTMLCFDPACKTEVLSLGTFMLVQRAADPNAPPVVSVACEACSTKSNEEILNILRPDIAEHFGIGPRPEMGLANGYGASFVAEGVNVGTFAGIQLAIVGEVNECAPAAAFAAMLETNKLPRFAFSYQGQNNCFAIVHQIYQDFAATGGERLIVVKEGFCQIMQPNGEPVGLHRWIEADGWAIDASGGALGNPVVFQRVEDFYSSRQMTDIRDVAIGPDELSIA